MKEDCEAVRNTKVCPICTLALTVSEFGVCRARKDGMNLYCKTCIRMKVNRSRKALKEYKSARKKYVPDTSVESPDYDSLDLLTTQPVSYSRPGSRMSPVERVREAIRSGARTQKEILHETKMGNDEIGEALASLLLWTHEIRTEVVDSTRMYFVNESPETMVPATNGQRIPQRKRDVPSSFSALHILMPGRNPELEPEKIGGWVAA